MTPRRVEKIQCEFFSSGQPEVTDTSQRLLLFRSKSESKPSEVCQEEVKEAVYYAADLHWLNDTLTSWWEGKCNRAPHHQLTSKDLPIVNFGMIPGGKVWLMTSIK